MLQRWVVVSAMFLLGCSGGDADPSPRPPADGAVSGVTSPAGPRLSLTAFEEQMLGAVVEDLRQGVRPFDDQSLGICAQGENARVCEQFLGADPGELAAGEYVLYGSFRVPKVGERGDWKVVLDVNCTTLMTRADGSTTETETPYSREMVVNYSGEDRGYTLSPLRRVVSPNPKGPQTCSWTLTAPHPDGDKVYTGGWSVPGPA